MKKTMITPIQPKLGGLEYFGILTNEIKGTRKPIHKLTNMEKEKFFRSIFDDVNTWRKRISTLDGFGYSFERTGIYTSLYSLFEYRLETLWLNYAYERKWGVYTNWFTNEMRCFPPNQYQWMNRDIPPHLRNAGNYFVDLYGQQIGAYKSVVNDEQIISDELSTRIQRSNEDRTQLIHRNCFYKKDIRNEHIETIIKNFREIDKMVKKHQRQHRELLIEPKIPTENLIT